MLLLGFVLAKVRILDEHSNRSLSQMVVSVTYPLMLLYSMAGQPGERSTALIVLGGGFVFYFVMIAVAKIAARLLRVPEEKRREFEMPDGLRQHRALSARRSRSRSTATQRSTRSRF